MMEINEILTQLQELRQEVSQLTDLMKKSKPAISAMQIPGFYTTEDACELLHVSENTLKKRRIEGELKYTRSGRRYLYPKSQFSKLL
jgi:excisionase family DNA binding protein